MAAATTVLAPDGRALEVHDAGGDGPPVVWHHGSPHTGALISPFVAAAQQTGVRLVTYARPGYGSSTPRPGRDVASAAEDVARVADALGLDRFGTVGHSGGGPHALACAALLADRVTGVVSLSGLAPWTTSFDWYAGMADDGALRAAHEGRAARVRHEEIGAFQPGVFTPGDWAALEGRWATVMADVALASAPEHAALGGLVDDDVAFASPWGFDPGDVGVPSLLVHGTHDRMVPASHSEQLAARCPHAELRLRDGDGHLGTLDALGDALAWLARLAAR